jgi:hypothetical protein
MEARGCAAEMQLFGDDPKVPQIPQLHVSVPILDDTPTASTRCDERTFA